MKYVIPLERLSGKWRAFFSPNSAQLSITILRILLEEEDLSPNLEGYTHYVFYIYEDFLRWTVNSFHYRYTANDLEPLETLQELLLK